MRKTILYIAVSLDGYIADSRGSVSWIGGQDESMKMEDTFTPFFSNVDTVIMGRNTVFPHFPHYTKPVISHFQAMDFFLSQCSVSHLRTGMSYAL
ncbi:MAG: dihydrofolate reductase family protein [Bacteroidales bacterium]|nr:dihydrofolate reductase family protein [Bacteroidales bacterium]